MPDAPFTQSGPAIEALGMPGPVFSKVIDVRAVVASSAFRELVKLSRERRDA